MNEWYDVTVDRPATRAAHLNTSPLITEVCQQLLQQRKSAPGCCRTPEQRAPATPFGWQWTSTLADPTLVETGNILDVVAPAPACCGLTALPCCMQRGILLRADALCTAPHAPCNQYNIRTPLWSYIDNTSRFLHRNVSASWQPVHSHAADSASQPTLGTRAQLIECYASRVHWL